MKYITLILLVFHVELSAQMMPTTPLDVIPSYDAIAVWCDSNGDNRNAHGTDEYVEVINRRRLAGEAIPMAHNHCLAGMGTQGVAISPHLQRVTQNPCRA